MHSIWLKVPFLWVPDRRYRVRPKQGCGGLCVRLFLVFTSAMADWEVEMPRLMVVVGLKCGNGGGWDLKRWDSAVEEDCRLCCRLCCRPEAVYRR
ncbi:hypothetical protein K469DRAFT_790388 [Zopfia rhizophila CBS 207.26]|uniref:Uncharacterized protein n=1 Tax=Zopfia rhizophila CBS 207.26 TaxID=1314779 RepID=A0A6A6DRQ6_9PEZI|nr:hypothetical protein K469DRAFT_790388 [Zopfia rhizophila CBS 207.26]